MCNVNASFGFLLGKYEYMYRRIELSLHRHRYKPNHHHIHNHVHTTHNSLDSHDDHHLGRIHDNYISLLLDHDDDDTPT